MKLKDKIVERTLFGALTFSLLLSSMASSAMGVPLSRVKVKEVIVSDLAPTEKMTGSLHSRDILQVTAGINARLEWVAEPGAFLTQGEPLVRFDPRPLLIEKSEQEAIIQRGEIQLNYLERDLKRIESLNSRKIASVDQLEQIQSRRDLAKSDLEITRVRLDRINERLERTVIRAPFNGIIAERHSRGGEEVSRGDVLARLIDTHNLELRLFIPVKHFAQMTIGKTLPLTALNLEFEGTVRAIVPNADVRSQTFEVRVDVPTAASQYWAVGQLIDTDIPVAASESALTVPRDALLLRRDGAYVVRIDQDNTAHRIKVNVGKAENDRVAVVGELSAGDRVAVLGAERVKNGQEVVVDDSAV